MNARSARPDVTQGGGGHPGVVPSLVVWALCLGRLPVKPERLEEFLTANTFGELDAGSDRRMIVKILR